jgi:hypothetical protein
MSQEIRRLGNNYNFIKGRIAEAIIERLFISLGMIPIHNGYEIKHPEIAYLRRTGQLPQEAMKQIEFGCDFIVRSAEKNSKNQYDLYQIEVKFSRSGQIEFRKLEFYDNDDLIFIFLDFDGFWCVSNQEIKTMRSATEASKLKFSKLSRLEGHHIFSFSEAQKLTIEKFVHFIHATLGEVQQNKELQENLEMTSSDADR